jgi:protein TonB
LLFCFLSLFRQSLMTIPQEPFHWEVALVQSTHTTDESVQTTHATEPVVSKPTERTSLSARPVRTLHRAASSADPIVPIEPQTAEPGTPTSQPSTASSAASPSDASETSTADKPTPSRQQASDPPLQQAERPANSTPAEPSRPQAAATTADDQSAAPGEAAQPSSSSATGSNTEAAATPRPDYGWLQQAIFRRLEELKRSSRPSLDDSRPLKVTVKAVVSRDGALLDSTVVKSSGLDRIDQEAMALVQRAFPMQLDRPLDRQQIAMRIPIIYSRE